MTTWHKANQDYQDYMGDRIQRASQNMERYKAALDSWVQLSKIIPIEHKADIIITYKAIGGVFFDALESYDRHEQAIQEAK